MQGLFRLNFAFVGDRQFDILAGYNSIASTRPDSQVASKGKRPKYVIAKERSDCGNPCPRTLFVGLIPGRRRASLRFPKPAISLGERGECGWRIEVSKFCLGARGARPSGRPPCGYFYFLRPRSSARELSPSRRIVAGSGTSVM